MEDLALVRPLLRRRQRLRPHVAPAEKLDKLEKLVMGLPLSGISCRGSSLLVQIPEEARQVDEPVGEPAAEPLAAEPAAEPCDSSFEEGDGDGLSSPEERKSGRGDIAPPRRQGDFGSRGASRTLPVVSVFWPGPWQAKARRAAVEAMRTEVLRRLGQEAVERALAAWCHSAVQSRARRAVREVCSQLRARALGSRALAAFAEHLRLRRAIQGAIAEALELWRGERRAEGLQKSLEAWRRRAARGLLRRRGAEALTRWLTTSRSRRWLDLWKQAHNHQRRLAAKVERHAAVSSRGVRRVFCAAWCRAAKLSRFQRLRSRAQLHRLRAIAWTVWRAFLRRSQNAARVTQSRSTRQAGGTVKGWRHWCQATECFRRCLAARSFAWWHGALRLLRAVRLIGERSEAALRRAAWLRWRKRVSLAQRGKSLRQHTHLVAACSVLREWRHLLAAVALADRSRARSELHKLPPPTPRPFCILDSTWRFAFRSCAAVTENRLKIGR
jgi:hypothetical protein